MLKQRLKYGLLMLTASLGMFSLVGLITYKYSGWGGPITVGCIFAATVLISTMAPWISEWLSSNGYYP